MSRVNVEANAIAQATTFQTADGNWFVRLEGPPFEQMGDGYFVLCMREGATEKQAEALAKIIRSDCRGLAHVGFGGLLDELGAPIE